MVARRSHGPGVEAHLVEQPPCLLSSTQQLGLCDRIWSKAFQTSRCPRICESCDFNSINHCLLFELQSKVRLLVFLGSSQSPSLLYLLLGFFVEALDNGPSHCLEASGGNIW